MCMAHFIVYGFWHLNKRGLLGILNVVVNEEGKEKGAFIYESVSFSILPFGEGGGSDTVNCHKVPVGHLGYIPKFV